MRKLISNLCILIFIVNNTYSTSYDCIKSNKTCFYENNRVVYATRIDSAIAKGSDSIFFNYKQIYQGFTCLNNKYSWLGRSVIKKADGSWIFVSEGFDSLLIKANLKAEESWQFAKNVKANLKLHEIRQILNVEDTVVTIELKSEVYKWLDGFQIEISQKFGFVRLFNFSKFPVESSAFVLLDSDNPHLGIVPTTLEDIYKYQEGDEFHIYDYLRTEVSNIKQVYYIKKFVSGSLSENKDTIKDIFQYCTREENTYHKVIDDKYVPFKRPVICSQNSIEEKHYYGESPLYKALPFQIFNTYNIAVIERNEYGTYSRKLIFPSFRLICDTCECAYDTLVAYDKRKSTQINFQSGRLILSLIPGVGNAFSENYFGSDKRREYKYIKTSSIETGTPYICDSLQSTNAIATKETKIKLWIYPNPASSDFKICIDEVEQKSGIEILTLTGQVLYNSDINTRETIISNSSLSRGIYIVRLLKKFKPIAQSYLVIQ